MISNHFYGVTPYFRPVLDGKLDNKPKSQRIDNMRLSIAQKQHQEKKLQDTKNFEAEQEKSRLEKQRIMQSRTERENQKQLPQQNDLQTEATQTLLQLYTVEIIRHQFPNKVGTTNYQDLEYFAKICRNEVIEEIVKANRADAEKARRKGDKCRPDYHFVKGVPFYRKVIVDCLNSMFDGKRRIAEGFKIRPVATITKENLDALKEEDIF